MHKEDRELAEAKKLLAAIQANQLPRLVLLTAQVKLMQRRP